MLGRTGLIPRHRIHARTRARNATQKCCKHASFFSSSPSFPPALPRVRHRPLPRLGASGREGCAVWPKLLRAVRQATPSAPVPLALKRDGPEAHVRTSSNVKRLGQGKPCRKESVRTPALTRFKSSPPLHARTRKRALRSPSDSISPPSITSRDPLSSIAARRQCWARAAGVRRGTTPPTAGDSR